MFRPTLSMRFCGMTLPGKGSRRNCGFVALTGLVGVERRVQPRRERVVNRNQVAAGAPEVAEVAGAGLRRRHGVDEHLAAGFLETGIVSEEERAVVAVVHARDDDGAAGRAAELMPVQRRLRIDLQPATRQRRPCARRNSGHRRRRRAGTRTRCRGGRYCPILSTTETTPAPRPNSAENTPESTLNSRTCSTEGAMITVLNEYSLLSMPSISQAFAFA